MPSCGNLAKCALSSSQDMEENLLISAQISSTSAKCFCVRSGAGMMLGERSLCMEFLVRVEIEHTRVPTVRECKRMPRKQFQRSGKRAMEGAIAAQDWRRA